ncbi:MAG: hypothetical protein AAF514_19825, partial [Verrucomicrobiota bacterium]
MSSNSPVFVGVDVQVQRPCVMVVLDHRLRMIGSAWLEGSSAHEVCQGLFERLELFGSVEAVTIGIDAPRQPLEAKRPFFWDRKANGWRKRKRSERGWGRHCEVIIRSSGLANPQWTPTLAESPPWMVLGYGLFRELESRGYSVKEVFPSAAYRLLEGERHLPVAIDFSAFAPGPKDVIDACMA